MLVYLKIINKYTPVSTSIQLQALYEDLIEVHTATNYNSCSLIFLQCMYILKLRIMLQIVLIEFEVYINDVLYRRSVVTRRSRGNRSKALLWVKNCLSWVYSLSYYNYTGTCMYMNNSSHLMVICYWRCKLCDQEVPMVKYQFLPSSSCGCQHYSTSPRCKSFFNMKLLTIQVWSIRQENTCLYYIAVNTNRLRQPHFILVWQRKSACHAWVCELNIEEVCLPTAQASTINHQSFCRQDVHYLYLKMRSERKIPVHDPVLHFKVIITSIS